MVKISAPGKLMLFGEHAAVYGYPCIVTAVDQRITVAVTKIKDRVLFIKAPDVGVTSYKTSILSNKLPRNLPKGVSFVEAAVRNFNKKYKISGGLKIETKSDFSSEFGFGSSSAATVATIAGLSQLFDKKLSKKDIFDLSYQTVLDVQRVASGFDLAAAIWGGTVYFVQGGKTIQKINAVSLPLIVGYTGIKADTASLVKKVANLKKRYPKLCEQIFGAMALIVESAQSSLKRKDYQKLGELMSINQGLLDSLGVNTTILSNLVFAARDGGAYGAKLSGAGGGDCMIAIAPEKKKKRVELAIKKLGGKVLKVQANAEGVRIEK